MPISATCACGKTLRAPDEFAGRRVKCPACGTPVAIPGQAVAITPSAPASSRPASRPTPPPASIPSVNVVRFTCVCGKGLQAQTSSAGRLVRCPACGDNVTIPGPEGGSESRLRADKPSSVARKISRPKLPEEDIPELEEVEAVDESDPEEEPEEEAAPRRKKGASKSVRINKGKKQGSRVLLWLGLSALLLIVLCGAGAGVAWWMLRPKEVTDDLSLVSGDAQGLISMRLSELATSETFKKVAAAPTPQNGMLATMERETGLKPEQVERFTFVITNISDPINGGWYVVRTKAPYDRSKILQTMGTTREVTVEGKTFLVGAIPTNSAYFAGSQVLVLGSEAGLRVFAQRTATPRAASPLDPALAMIAENQHHIVATMIPDPLALLQTRGSLAANPIMKPFDPILAVQSVTATVDMSDLLVIDMNATYADEAKAKAAKDALDKGLVTFKAMFPANGPVSGKPNPQMESMKALSKLVSQLKPELNAAVINLKLSLAPEALSGLAAMPLGGAAAPNAGANTPAAPGSTLAPMEGRNGASPTMRRGAIRPTPPRPKN
jgi:hypothetical protein